MPRLESWKDLKVWRRAHELVLVTYKVTSKFPGDEKFGLMSQMRRAAVSVASNIVEGFRRKTVKDSLNFYNMAMSSLEELKYQYVLSLDLQYLSKSEYSAVFATAEEVSKMLYVWQMSQERNTVVRS